MLLLRFGVQARIREIEYTDKRNGAERKIWHLQVSGIGQLAKFLDAIGDIPGKEDACQRIRTYCSARKANTNVDCLPITWGWLNDRMVELGIKRPAGNPWWKLGTARVRRLSRDMFAAWLDSYGETGLGRQLRESFPGSTSYERVASIEPMMVAIPVGDIGAHNGNRFLAQGIQVHNSIGWGKSFFASIAACRILYELSCMRDPHKSFGIGKGSDITMVVLSVKEDLAIKVAFENIANKIKESDYFKENFPFKPMKKEILFPNKIQVAARASTDSAALGLNVFSAFIDEGNFMQPMKKKGSIESRVGGEDRARHLYNQLMRRMKSRFQRHGKLPGMMIVVSSKQTRDDFTAKRIKESKDDPTVFVRDYCLSGDTEIPLLDGNCLSIRQLAEEFSEREFWLYSYDKKKGCIVPGLASRPRLTARDEKVLAVRLDNDEVVRATSWHPFLMRDGTYKRADQLMVGDSVMPFYSRLNSDGYEEIVQPNWKKGWQKTHHMVARSAFGSWPKRGSDGLPTVIHHCDHSERNNCPENLRPMAWTEHREHHAKQMDRLTEYVKSEKHRQYASDHMSKLHKDPEFARARNERGAEHFKRLWSDPEFRESHRRQASETLKAWHRRPESVEAQRRNSLIGWEGRRLVTIEAVCEGAREGLLLRELADRLGCSLAAICQALKRAGMPRYSDLKKQMASSIPRNHKVVAIEDGGTADVYDLSVSKHENFALSSGVFVHNSTWMVKPKGTYSEETFSVLVGNDLVPSRILEPEEVEVVQAKLQDGMVIVDVPIDFRVDFENNLEDAIRDTAGIATTSVSPFIQQLDRIVPCIDANRDHPFTVDEWVQTEGGKVNWTKIAHQVEVRDGAEVQRSWQPRFFPGAARHVHIDPSLNSDSTGFAIGCVTGYKTVVRRDPETREQYTESAPEIWVDMLLRVNPPIGGEIDYGLIRSLVYQFTGHGFSISLITMDQFNSADGLQKFAKKGFTAERLSVDKPMDAYDTLKAAIYEGRVRFYKYEPLLEELRTIQKDNIRNKVDHPRGKTKDLADALAGIVFTLSTRYYGSPMGVIKGISNYSDPVLDEQREMVDEESSIILPFLQG